jgi:transmembrane sensor
MTKEGDADHPKDDAEITDNLSWRDGVLVFNQQTLAEAHDQFNRYNERQDSGGRPGPQIASAAASRPIMDVFVLLLHRGFGLSVNEQGSTIVVSR